MLKTYPVAVVVATGIAAAGLLVALAGIGLLFLRASTDVQELRTTWQCLVDGSRVPYRIR